MAEPHKDDVERYEAYWDGFSDGVDSSEKEWKHKFSQFLLTLERTENVKLLRSSINKKQKELSERKL